ncbi:MAG: family 78 glycoside hydrolase catalytic domain [Anaerolineae bacterium]|nr:family 78 glycoside hydrolase catalytic domain [Anaerolineae bacterium]
MNSPSFSPLCQWIWGEDDAATHNVWRYFRRDFTVPPGSRRATLLITADSRYECSINGHFLGRGPARSFPFSYSYDVYDLTPYLRSGERNTLTVLANYLGDHTMTYIRGRAGFLCEVLLEDAQGNLSRLSSDAHWKTTPCHAFSPRAPRIAIQLDFEEQYDARLELAGWESPAYDASSWKNAIVIGPLGCEPWTHLEPRSIPFLTEDGLAPQQVKAVELARPRSGITWTLDLRELNGNMRTGLRSAPPGERGSTLFTEVFAPRACKMWIHSFPNYEALAIRVNNQRADRVTMLDVTAKPVEFALQKGANVVMTRDTEWPSFLFECDEPLEFSAERFVEGAAWVLLAPLNELTGEVEAWWQADSLDALPTGSTYIGIPASAHQPDIASLTVSQRYYAIEGGFCSADIAGPTPRELAPGSRPTPVLKPEALLHDTGDWTTVHPQPDGDVHLVIDFGREVIGHFHLELNAPEGAIVDANFFEGIDATGIFWTQHLRNTLRYVCREGWQMFTSHQRRGYRYVSLTLRNLSRPLHIRHISTRLATYPVEARGSFACSDETLNRIWQVAAYTVQLCMLDTYVDCPAYEQVFWVGDARNSALVNAVAFGAYDLTDRCIRLTGQSLSDEMKSVKPPHLHVLRPHLTASHVVSGWFNEIPMWTFLWIWMAWEQYLNVGAQDALADYYRDIRECLRRCEGFVNERDLFDVSDVWNLVDWAAQDHEGSGEAISNTALMAQSLDYAANMADTLGLDAEASDYRALARRLRAAVNRYGWSDQYQAYVDTVRDEWAYERYKNRDAVSLAEFQAKQRISEPTNTLVLLCGVVPPERYESVMRLVLAAKAGHFVGSSAYHARFGKPDEIVRVGSPWFLFFTLQALFEQGRADDALPILREQWNRMLEKGATTFWETFPGDVSSGHWSRSLCHGWSAAPAYFLSTQVLGITPAAPGYRRIRIAPKPCQLKWASGTVPTPHGLVSVAWHRDGDKLAISYTVPEGCEVELIAEG